MSPWHGIANWELSQAAALTESWLLKRSDIELILCNNDDMALGAADAVARLGLELRNIVGIDGTPQGLEAVEDGKLLGTVVMDYAAHGQAIFQLSRALGAGEELGEMENMENNSIRIPMYIHKSW